MSDTYMTTTEVAVAINVHPDTLRSWEKQGKLLPDLVTFGRHRRYKIDNVIKQLEKLMELRKREANVLHS